MNVFRIFLVLTMLLLLLPSSLWAVHKGAGDLVCGSCHTMHNSQGRSQLNVSGPVDGSLILLRGPVTARSEIHKLCLQCHSTEGAQADVAHQPHGKQAPKVHIVGGDPNGLDIWNEADSFDRIGAGGNFYPEVQTDFSLNPGYAPPDPGAGAGDQVAIGKGHSVGLTNVVPPGNFIPLDFLTCTTCHNPHGTDVTKRSGAFDEYGQVHKFRNLRALGGGNIPGDNFTSWVGGWTGRFDSGGNYDPAYTGIGNNIAIWPVYNGDPTDPNDSNSYDGKIWNFGDPTDPPNLAGWCATCHMLWHEVPSPLNASGEDWTRHPVDKTIGGSDVSGTGVSTIDWTHYSTEIQDGKKLPAADANLSGRYYADVEGGDKVFCLSCHFVHGGPYYDNLRWDYLVGVEAGSETGYGVPSNRGCQQCHNRGWE